MNATQKKEAMRENERSAVKQYVTFMIGNEYYGVEVLKVQEIIGMTQIVYVPNSADFMKGVINLRGTVVPVVDMRKRFRMPEREYDMFTVIIIVEVKNRMIGMIVDSVSDVVEMEESEIQETPHFAVKIETDYIRGMGQVDDKLVIILDIDKILSASDLEKMNQDVEEAK
ncbi:MAG: chemotaxis protein CheW [Spirochaetes bacterium]|nr:chemotaxis protein CheW [Spirochaetota bacterium]